MYDASTGRFISRDPIQDGYNWYTYCENDPLNAIDPEGLSTIPWDKLAPYTPVLAIPGVGAVIGVVAIIGLIGLGIKAKLEHPIGSGVFDMGLNRGMSASDWGYGVNYGEHNSNTQPSLLPKHQKGEKRRATDQGGEAGDRRRNRPKPTPTPPPPTPTPKPTPVPPAHQQMSEADLLKLIQGGGF
jgi:uncharacterized protein RhaS with RHS repeats